jgi:hypothetical protein
MDMKPAERTSSLRARVCEVRGVWPHPRSLAEVLYHFVLWALGRRLKSRLGGVFGVPGPVQMH